MRRSSIRKAKFMAHEGILRLFPATRGDLAWARSFLTSLGLPGDGLEEQFERGYVVAERGGERVGLGGVEVYGDYGLLRSVGVVEAARGTSAGRAIVENRVAWAKANGLLALFLLTETAEDFFTHLGFETVPRETFPPEVQRSVEFSQACPDSAAAMCTRW